MGYCLRHNYYNKEPLVMNWLFDTFHFQIQFHVLSFLYPISIVIECKNMVWAFLLLMKKLELSLRMHKSLWIYLILWSANGIDIWLKLLIICLVQNSSRCNSIFSKWLNVVENCKRINLYVCRWWLVVTHECIKMHYCFVHTFKIDMRVRYC